MVKVLFDNGVVKLQSENSEIEVNDEVEIKKLVRDLHKAASELEKWKINNELDTYPKVDISLIKKELENYKGVDFNDVKGIVIEVEKMVRFPENGSGAISGGIRVLFKKKKKFKDKYHTYDKDYIHIIDSFFVANYFSSYQIWNEETTATEIKRMLSEEFLLYLEEKPEFELWFNDEQVVDLFDDEEWNEYYFGENRDS